MLKVGLRYMRMLLWLKPFDFVEILKEGTSSCKKRFTNFLMKVS